MTPGLPRPGLPPWTPRRILAGGSPSETPGSTARLVHLVQETRAPTIATRLGVPRSTVEGRIRRAPRSVAAAADGDASLAELRRSVARLENCNQRLTGVLRVLFILLCTVAPDLSRLRIPALDKERLLRAIERTCSVLGFQRVLARLGLSAARLHAWRNAALVCRFADQASCSNSPPQRLTSTEVAAIAALVTLADDRHVPTSRLAVLAQRMGASSHPRRLGRGSSRRADGADCVYASTRRSPRSAIARRVRAQTRNGTSIRR